MRSMMWSPKTPAYGYRLAIAARLPSLAIYISTVAAFAMVMCIVLGIAR